MIERQQLPVFPTLVLAAACSSFPGLSGWLLLLLWLLLCPQVTPACQMLTSGLPPRKDALAMPHRPSELHLVGMEVPLSLFAGSGCFLEPC